MSEEEIVKICRHYDIENYTINPDMSIDVNEYLYLTFKKDMTHFPLKFNKVLYNFMCHDNNLTTLKGGPVFVGSHFNCSKNQLSSLNDLPMNFHIGGDFYCTGNNITEPKEYGKLFFGYINGDIYTGGHSAIDIFLNTNKNPPKKDLPRLLSELRKMTR